MQIPEKNQFVAELRSLNALFVNSVAPMGVNMNTKAGQARAKKLRYHYQTEQAIFFEKYKLNVEQHWKMLFENDSNEIFDYLVENHWKHM